MDITNFEKLPDEKRLAILNAGILCFGQSGYQKTAISEIAAEAGVSKAAIFHYFGTKKDLYLYLYNYAHKELLERLSKGTKDYFESLTTYTQARIQLIKKHPGMEDFLRLQNQKNDFDAPDELVSMEKQHCEQGIAMLFNQVDWNRFQEGYDKDTVINLTAWVGEGCLKHFTETMSLDEAYLEVERYFTILKRALYKPEYL